MERAFGLKQRGVVSGGRGAGRGRRGKLPTINYSNMNRKPKNEKTPTTIIRLVFSVYEDEQQRILDS